MDGESCIVVVVVVVFKSERIFFSRSLILFPSRFVSEKKLATIDVSRCTEGNIINPSVNHHALNSVTFVQKYFSFQTFVTLIKLILAFDLTFFTLHPFDVVSLLSKMTRIARNVIWNKRQFARSGR